MYTKLIESKIRASINELSLLKDQYIHKKINEIVYLIKDTIKKKNKIIFCGNGGSASDAQHISAEFVGRFQKNRKALPSIAINSDTAIITALANDYGYDKIFSRQIEAIAKKNDLLIALSTSGKSKNILNAFKSASKMKLNIVFFTSNRCLIKEKKNILILKVPSENTARIQEMHKIILHLICGFFDY